MKTVPRTRMPALWAERREPPTARMCQPGRERVSATWATTAMTMAAITADRQAEDRAVADEVPDVGGDVRELDLRGVIDHQNVVERRGR